MESIISKKVEREFSKRFRQERKRKGLLQKEVAERAGFNPSTTKVSFIEKGKWFPPKETAMRLIRALSDDEQIREDLEQAYIKDIENFQGTEPHGMASFFDEILVK